MSTEERFPVCANNHHHAVRAGRVPLRSKPFLPLLFAAGCICFVSEPASSQNSFSVGGAEIAVPFNPNPTPYQGYFAGGATTDMPHHLLLGSAPSPNSADLCALNASDAMHCFTDATMKARRTYIPDPKNPGHFREFRPGDEKLIEGLVKAQSQVPHMAFGLGGG